MQKYSKSKAKTICRIIAEAINMQKQNKSSSYAKIGMQEHNKSIYYAEAKKRAVDMQKQSKSSNM